MDSPEKPSSASAPLARSLGQVAGPLWVSISSSCTGPAHLAGLWKESGRELSPSSLSHVAHRSQRLMVHRKVPPALSSSRGAPWFLLRHSQGLCFCHLTSCSQVGART